MILPVVRMEQRPQRKGKVRRLVMRQNLRIYRCEVRQNLVRRIDKVLHGTTGKRPARRTLS